MSQMAGETACPTTNNLYLHWWDRRFRLSFGSVHFHEFLKSLGGLRSSATQCDPRS